MKKLALWTLSVVVVIIVGITRLASAQDVSALEQEIIADQKRLIARLDADTARVEKDSVYAKSEEYRRNSAEIDAEMKRIAEKRARLDKLYATSKAPQARALACEMERVIQVYEMELQAVKDGEREAGVVNYYDRQRLGKRLATAKRGRAACAAALKRWHTTMPKCSLEESTGVIDATAGEQCSAL